MFRNFLWFSDLNSKINELLRRLQPPFRIQRPNLWYQSKKFTTVSAWAHAITTLLPRRSNRIGSDVRPTPLLPQKSHSNRFERASDTRATLLPRKSHSNRFGRASDTRATLLPQKSHSDRFGRASDTRATLLPRKSHSSRLGHACDTTTIRLPRKSHSNHYFFENSNCFRKLSYEKNKNFEN